MLEVENQAKNGNKEVKMYSITTNAQKMSTES